MKVKGESISKKTRAKKKKKEGWKAGARINNSFCQYPIPSATSLAHSHKPEGPHLDSPRAGNSAEVQPGFSELSSWRL